MRYYLIRITYNKVAKAEDRPAPKGFDTLDAAKKDFHSYMTQSILGETIGWCLGMIINEFGVVQQIERWAEEVELEPEEAEALTE